MYFDINNSVCVFLLLMKHASSSESNKYDSNQLYQKYPGYGDIWMYFPDDVGIPHIAILEFPKKDNGKIFSNAEQSVSFTLYTRNKPEGKILSIEDDSIDQSSFDFNKDTKFLTHGWMSSGNKSTCQEIKDAYLKNDDYNIIIVDWSSVANNVIYPLPAFNTENVGVEIAKFLDYLICKKYNPSKIHLIGHSLGAHVMGIAGTKNNGRVGRVTGLDPANPIFNFGILEMLSNKSANFVDVIHTSSGAAGMGDPLGHVDFYPNGGGPPQPGCFGLTEVIEGCSHASSWKFYVNSIRDQTKYMAYRCSTYGDYEKGMCKDNAAYMGESASVSARGSYYLSTGVA